MVQATRRRRSGTKFGPAVVVVATWFALVGASMPAPVAFQTFPSPLSPRAGEAGVLSIDLGDRYTYSSSSGALRAAALDANQSSNLRAVVWPSSAVPTADAQSCATWRHESHWSDQEGAALRVRRDGAGAIHGVTVTKNIWDGATWLFNVHEWNSSQTPAFHQLGAVDLSGVFRDANGTPVPLPWRMCARVLGTAVQVKAWPLTHAEPSWGDPRYGGSVELDREARTSGMAGWYLGHLRARDTVDLTDLGLWTFGSTWSGLSGIGAAVRSAPHASSIGRGPSASITRR